MKITLKEDWALWKKGDDIEVSNQVGASVINRGIAKPYKAKSKKAKSKKS